MFSKKLDNTDSNSLANKFRKERFKIFLEYISDLKRPVKILDVGGTDNFWKQMGVYGDNNLQITILNLDAPENSIDKNLRFMRGDARDLSGIADKSYDVVFSNSVIEHIESAADRQKMANEVIRTGKRYFVQTPNYYFPFEPHFLFPFFQFFPKWLKIWLLLNFEMGWFKKCKNRDEADMVLNSNKLLKSSELRGYYKNCRIVREKYIFLTKSIIATSPIG